MKSSPETAEVLISPDEETTLEIGRQIGRKISPPRIVLIVGELGSGKTVLARGICEGLDLSPGTVVHSPTFTLVNEYPSRTGTIYHIDLYRLETLRDLYSIGIEDILTTDAVVLVEWAEKLQLDLENALHVFISRTHVDGQRVIRMEPGLGLAEEP